MIHFELLRSQGILIVTPQGPLQKTDFDLVWCAAKVPQEIWRRSPIYD